MRTLAWSIGEWLLKRGRGKARVLMVCENEVALLLMSNGQVVNVNGDLTEMSGVLRGVFAVALSLVALDLTGQTTWLGALEDACERMENPDLFLSIKHAFEEQQERQRTDRTALDRPVRPGRWGKKGL